jgi:hypothetical protein
VFALNKKGQTAQEYLLIVVVAILVVVAVMYFMSSTSKEIVHTLTMKDNELMCRQTSCKTSTEGPPKTSSSECIRNTVCDGLIDMPEWAGVACMGVSSVGSENLAGHCEPY